MSRPQPRPPRRPRTARLVALGAGVVAIVAASASMLLVVTAEGGDSRTATQDARVLAGAKARAALEKIAATVPLAVDGRCVRTVVVPGQGPSCRTPEGMYLVPQAGAPALMTHGPDIVDSGSRSGRSGGFGTAGSIVCSPASRTRYVLLAYLLPSDYATAGDLTHGDRFGEVADQLRQAEYDVSELIDRRAQQLAGQRRRLRVLCDQDGRPTVERIVLRHTALEIIKASNGFKMIGDDLEARGYLPEYHDFSTKHLPAMRRLLGYYDAEFQLGFAGQGTLFARDSMLGQGFSSSDPLVSRTNRNINNNGPRATLAVQYGSSTYVGATPVPDPPLYTSLAHELSHTMGAVQDEPPTASDVGHCVDGLDVMCYADGGTTGTYTDTICPDPAPPYAPEDEVYDCNGDTYFNPAPAAGNPLNAPNTWHLGLVANETLATHSNGAPAAVTGLSVSGTGTRRTLRWTPVVGASGYEVAYRRGGTAWESTFVAAPPTVPLVRPSSSYELRVSAIGPGLVVGPGAVASVHTGLDNTPPTAPTNPAAQFVLRTSFLCRYVFPADNVAVTKIRVEKRTGTRWVLHSTIIPPRSPVAGTAVGSVVGSLHAGTRYLLRLRAVDTRGNVSVPSRTLSVMTSR